MDYELAKELKGSGFPQDVERGGWVFYRMKQDFDKGTEGYRLLCISKGEWFKWGLGHFEEGWNFDQSTEVEEWKLDRREYVKIPTLSELIEACGDGMFALEARFQGDWEAHIPHKYERSLKIGIGLTPEVAVARLWLALRKKR